MIMDDAPVDRTTTWGVAAVAAAQATAIENKTKKPQNVSIYAEALWGGVEEDSGPKQKVEVRSILVRDLPRHLGTDEAAEALRLLFSEAAPKAGFLQNVHKGSQAQRAPPPVAARQGALPQSSWKNNRRYTTEASKAASSKANASLNQRKQLLQQLPHAVCGIRVASDQKGGSAYAIVDFSHEMLANLALQLLGNNAVLPGTLSQVRLSLHETWSTPLVVDQYQLYIAGLPPGATAEHVEALVRATTAVVPSHVKMAAVSGIPSRRGMKEYAFLRFADDEAANGALTKLEEASASLQLIVRRLYEHRHRGNPTEPLTHAANCSIFIANLPPMTNSEELRELCSYFHLVRAAEVHPTRNFGFVRLASHEAALAAISHLRGTQLHGRTLSCAWSSRCLPVIDEGPPDDAWERAEEAYAVMSAQCMDCESTEASPDQPPELYGKAALTPKSAAKNAVVEAAGDAFWLSFLAESGPLTVSDICSQLKQRQQKAQRLRLRLQQWQDQEWEEDTKNMAPDADLMEPLRT